MRIFLLWLGCTGLAMGATVKGVLEDGTNGGEGSADLVQLINLSRGMAPIALLTDVTGPFELQFEGDAEGGQLLLQAKKGNASYSAPVPDPGQPVSLKVYDGAADVAMNIRIATLAVLAYEDTLEIGVFYNLDNVSDPPKTLDRPNATFSFPVIPGYRDIQANSLRGNLPLRQNLSIEDGIASINYALKPGRTSLRVHSTHPYNVDAANPYAIPVFEGQSFMHVLAMPSGLELEAPGLEFASTDNQTGYDLFQWQWPEGQTSLDLKVSGAPAPSRQAISERSQSEEVPSGHPESKFESSPNVLHAYRWWIIGAVLTFLGLFSVISLTPGRS